MGCLALSSHGIFLVQTDSRVVRVSAGVEESTGIGHPLTCEWGGYRRDIFREGACALARKKKVSRPGEMYPKGAAYLGGVCTRHMAHGVYECRDAWWIRSRGEHNKCDCKVTVGLGGIGLRGQGTQEGIGG